MGLFDSIRNPFEKASSIFEESTTLGKGVTFAKIQVALEAPNRSSGSILGLLADKADAADTDSARGLAKLVSEVALALVRKSDDWVASSSTTQNFLGSQAEGKCETFYNRAVSEELGKFEKEYVPPPGSPAAGPSTLVVVSLLCALRGDKTNFGNVGGDRAATTKALQVLAGDVQAERGELLVAAEVLWTPSDDDEVMTRRDMFLDYPELMDV